MLRHQSQINGYAIHASDGLIGTVTDFLFDDTTWLVRWLIVDTGHWLIGRKVLLPPNVLGSVNHIGHEFAVKLTKQQVKECPDAGTDLPVSRETETSIYNYYGWSPYWGSGSYMGLVGYGGGSMGEVPSLELMEREKAIDDAARAKRDPTLCSGADVTGYRIHASDGDIGHVEDFLVEDDDWSIHYLVVDTGNWWPEKKIIISPLAVRTVQWADRRVNLGVDRGKVKESRSFDPLATVDPIYERNIHTYDRDAGRREGV